jgi:hypothetical protein
MVPPTINFPRRLASPTPRSRVCPWLSDLPRSSLIFQAVPSTITSKQVPSGRRMQWRPMPRDRQPQRPGRSTRRWSAVGTCMHCRAPRSVTDQRSCPSLTSSDHPGHQQDLRASIARSAEGNPVELIGWSAERAALQRSISAVSGGASRSLVVHGEPDTGKIALLDDVLGHGECRVVRGVGVQSEMEPAFAGLAAGACSTARSARLSSRTTTYGVADGLGADIGSSRSTSRTTAGARSTWHAG